MEVLKTVLEAFGPAGGVAVFFLASAVWRLWKENARLNQQLVAKAEIAAKAAEARAKEDRELALELLEHEKATKLLLERHEERVHVTTRDD